MKRRYVNKRERRSILAKQKGYCYYCGQAFGELAWYRKPVVLNAELDHVVPYTLSTDCSYNNFVMACQVCNTIKRDKIFGSLKELRNFVLNKWKEHGEMTVNRKRSVSVRHMSEYAYGKKLCKYDDPSPSQLKFIRDMIKKAKEMLQEQEEEE